MSKVQYVGRVSLNFYGKYLSEIAKNLRNRGKGRMVIKESEIAQYQEPCFYILDRVVPLMSDDTNVRCRSWGRRMFRGHDFGLVRMDETHVPDWRLVPSDEANELMKWANSEQAKRAPDVPVTCFAPMPPLLALKLRRGNNLPLNTIKNAESFTSSDTTLANTAREANGFLLLVKHPEDATSFKVPIVPSIEEQGRIHPPYEIAARDGLFEEDKTSERMSYYIRRSDTPDLYWKVILAEDNKIAPIVRDKPNDV